jgi:hypothetical protein
MSSRSSINNYETDNFVGNLYKEQVDVDGVFSHYEYYGEVYRKGDTEEVVVETTSRLTDLDVADIALEMRIGNIELNYEDE